MMYGVPQMQDKIDQDPYSALGSAMLLKKKKKGAFIPIIFVSTLNAKLLGVSYLSGNIIKSLLIYAYIRH